MRYNRSGNALIYPKKTMTILNPFRCEKCKRELQPENILVGFKDMTLVRICAFCGNKVLIKEKKQ